MLTLLPAEQKWLAAYRKALDARYPGAVERVAVFGSKARGDSRAESDLDVLVLVNTNDRMEQREMSLIGHQLTNDLYLAGDDSNTLVLASIMVYAADEWADRLQHKSLFPVTVEQEAVEVHG